MHSIPIARKNGKRASLGGGSCIEVASSKPRTILRSRYVIYIYTHTHSGWPIPAATMMLSKHASRSSDTTHFLVVVAAERFSGSGQYLHPCIVLQESDNLWWDAFATEFFEDDATLTLTFCLEDGPKRYSKWRSFISFCFFSSKHAIVYSVVQFIQETWKTHLRDALGEIRRRRRRRPPVARFSFRGTTRSSSRSIVPASGPYARTTRSHTF